ncbi:MAG: histidinol-phosphatase HisJ family protein [Armatimonadetes bacterium]|nr:histidinol-phosphatase HisJ family protein [Armatimonadota bacterium]MDW8153823.1 histidinol-phosphatase HisJ family protein [Armatimonadota bacterium]
MGRAHPHGATVISRPDYHTHLENVGLHWEALVRLVEAALRVGVTEIGLTEHAHNFVQCRTIYPSDNTWVHARDVPERRNWDFDAYVRLLDRARAEGLPVKAGMEWDYCPGYERELERWIRAYDWDFTLGGVHWLRGRDGGWWGFDIPDQRAEWENRSVDEVYAEYFRLLAEAARTGLFDVLAHPDVVKVFGHRPKGDPLPWYEEAAQAMARAGVCAEVSTAGLRKPVGELYPAEGFLRVLHRWRVPIVTSSDAHLPEHVGYAFDRAEAAAQAAGYRTRCVFTRRKRSEVPIRFANV